MNKNLLKQFSLLFFICILALVIFTKENKIINASEIVTQPTLKESQVFLLPVQKKNNAAEDQRSVDRAINILGIVATSMGVLVAILTLILLILGGLGFWEISKWKKVRKNIEEDANFIKKLKEKAKENVDEMQKFKPPSLTEKPTSEIKAKLDQFSHRLETLEILGISLKPEDYIKRGIDLYYKKKYGLALEAFNKAIELKPNDAEAWSSKGIVLDNLKRHDEALEVFNKTIELKPNDAEAWSSKGAALGNLKRYDEALEVFNKAIELKPDFARAWHNKGIAFDNLKRHDEALEAFNKAIELKPNDAEAWSSKGIALNNLKRYDEALEVFNKAIELKPDYTGAWYNKACTYSLRRNKEKALKYLLRAIKLDIKYKKNAKKDKDFKDFWDDEDFKNIVK